MGGLAESYLKHLIWRRLVRLWIAYRNRHRHKMSQVVPGIWAPMDGLNSYDPLMGGYQFCDITDNGATFHPGCDLNCGNGGDADLGVYLRLPIPGIIHHVIRWDGRSTGYGNHLWAELENGDWLHYCHMDDVYVDVGEVHPESTIIGTCGKSGFQTWAHCHLECNREGPYQGNPNYWPYGQPRSFVEAHYIKPGLWWQELLRNWNPNPEAPTVTLLADWQIKEWIMRPLWEENGFSFNPDAAVTEAWIADLKGGYYRGRPRQNERQAGEGTWQEFERGLAVYQPGQPVSWEG